MDFQNFLLPLSLSDRNFGQKCFCRRQIDGLQTNFPSDAATLEKSFYSTTTMWGFHVVLSLSGSLKLQVSIFFEYSWFLTYKNIDNKSILMNHFASAFALLKIVIKWQTFFISSFIVRHILFLFDIRKQLITTCFNVCLLALQKQFKWLNSKILRTYKNFNNSIFSIHICVIRLLFIFVNLMCYVIFVLYKSLAFNKSFNAQFNDWWILCAKNVFLSTSIFMIYLMLHFVSACDSFTGRRFWQIWFFFDIFGSFFCSN